LFEATVMLPVVPSVVAVRVKVVPLALAVTPVVV